MKALPKNRRSPSVPQAPQHEDGQDVLLPAETKQRLSALRTKAPQSPVTTVPWQSAGEVSPHPAREPSTVPPGPPG